MLLTRRKIGPAYEVTPAESTGRWLRDHSLRVIAAVLVIFLFCGAVDWIFYDLLNFMAAEKAYNETERVVHFNASDMIPVTVQWLGSAVLGFYFLFRFKVHAKF